MTAPLPQRLAAEALGTGLLVATVVGSGIMAERLAGGNVALALLANTLATVAGLIALILTFGPISGAHFNPAVSLSDGSPLRHSIPYCAAQIAGGCLGSILANAMFSLPLVSFSRHARAGFAQLLGEFVATFGLLAVIWGVSRTRTAAVPFAVGAWIAAAYWFTSSTSFANPAVTIARCLSDTFAGIRPVDAPWFIVAQLAGAFTATALFRWMGGASPTVETYAADLHR
jgi:glycerol uptake facilitator-like aquaporin